jgi:hypothetical protein
MTELTPLHEALLELGLEDWIPLPEICATPEIRGLSEHDQEVKNVAHALVQLLRQGRIQVWTGHWPDEPMPVSTETAEAILFDEGRYSFDAETAGLERVYYANVENFRAESAPT